MQQAIRTKVIDGNDRFVDEFAPVVPPPPPDAPLENMRDWIRGLFGGGGPPRPPGPNGLPPVTTDPGYPSGPPVPAEERVGG